MKWGPGEDLKATAEHHAVREGNGTPERTGRSTAGGKDEGGWGALGGGAADILHHSRRQNWT